MEDIVAKPISPPKNPVIRDIAQQIINGTRFAIAANLAQDSENTTCKAMDGLNRFKVGLAQGRKPVDKAALKSRSNQLLKDSVQKSRFFGNIDHKTPIDVAAKGGLDVTIPKFNPVAMHRVLNVPRDDDVSLLSEAEIYRRLGIDSVPKVIPPQQRAALDLPEKAQLRVEQLICIDQTLVGIFEDLFDADAINICGIVTDPWGNIHKLKELSLGHYRDGQSSTNFATAILIDDLPLTPLDVWPKTYVAQLYLVEKGDNNGFRDFLQQVWDKAEAALRQALDTLIEKGKSSVPAAAALGSTAAILASSAIVTIASTVAFIVAEAAKLLISVVGDRIFQPVSSQLTMYAPRDNFPLRTTHTVVEHDGAYWLSIVWEESTPKNQWYAKRLLGDLSTQSASGTISALENGTQKHLLFRTSDDHLLELYNPFGGWNIGGMHRVAQGLKLSSDPFTYMLYGPHVIFRADNNEIYEIFWSGQFFNIHSLSRMTGARSAAGAPKCQVCGEWQQIFYRGSDDLIHTLYHHPGQGWRTGPIQVSGHAKADSDPAVYDFGSLHVIYRAKDNHIYELYWGNSQWNLGCLTKACGAPLAKGNPQGYHSSGSQHIIYRDQNDCIQELYWTPHTSWRRGGLEYASKQQPASSDPTGYFVGNMQQVFYVGADSDVHMLFLPPNDTKWKISNLTELTQSPSPAGNLFAHAGARGVYVYYHDETGDIIQLRWAY